MHRHARQGRGIPSEDPNRRRHRGLELARGKHPSFRRITEDTWLVPSATSADPTYVVDASRETCTCPDFGEGGERCKHLWAVAYVQNEITLLDGTHLAAPPVTEDETTGRPISTRGAS